MARKLFCWLIEVISLNNQWNTTALTMLVNLTFKCVNHASWWSLNYLQGGTRHHYRKLMPKEIRFSLDFDDIQMLPRCHHSACDQIWYLAAIPLFRHPLGLGSIQNMRYIWELLWIWSPSWAPAFKIHCSIQNQNCVLTWFQCTIVWSQLYPSIPWQYLFEWWVYAACSCILYNIFLVRHEKTFESSDKSASNTVFRWSVLSPV